MFVDFAVVQVFGYILLCGSSFPTFIFNFDYTLARHHSHPLNVLFHIPRHDRSKEGGNKRLVYKLFKILRGKAKPRAKNSSVKWKCEKEMVHLAHNYSVTGNLENIKN